MMNIKKKVLICVVSVVVVAAIIALLCFVFLGKNEDSNNVRLDGVWKVTSNVTDGGVNIPENEYMIFSSDSVSDYRNGSNSPYASSKYKVDGDVLSLLDMSRTYHISKNTDSYISLYTSENTFMTLVKAESEDILTESFNPDSVTGKWNVIYRNTDKTIENEYFIFDNGKLTDYRNNSDKPTVETEYEWRENIIYSQSLGIEMACSYVAIDTIVLVDVNSGYVWILSKDS